MVGVESGFAWLVLWHGVRVVVAGLTAFQPKLTLPAAGILASVLLVSGLLGSAWFGRQLAAIVAVFRKPAVWWGLVAFGGLGTVLASGVAFDRDDQIALEQSIQNLEMAVSRVPSQPTDEAHAATDRGNKIILKVPTEPREDMALHGTEEKTLHDAPFHDQLIRRSGPTDHSNCHGWVFTGGKFLLSPDDVELILKENGYYETHEPRSGDLVIYRQAGAVSHTAIVRYVSEGQPVLVEGKWGAMGVFLHPANTSFYGTEFTFHRSTRTGHLLVGIGGSPGPMVEVANAVAE